MLISPAYAQAAGGGGGDMLTTMLPLILIFVVFYFLLIRPQQKKAKEHQAMLADLRRGDRIITAGGLIGTITRVVGDDELTVEVAEGVRVRVARPMVSQVTGKGRSRPQADEDDEDLDMDDEPREGEKRQG